MGVGRYCTAGGGQCRGTTAHTALWTFNQVSQLSAPNRVAPMPIAVQERFAVDQDWSVDVNQPLAKQQQLLLPRALPPTQDTCAEGIPAGGTLGGQPPAAGADNGDLGGILGGGGGLLTMLISFIGGGGGNDGGDESCDFFDQLLSFIGLANCSGGGASGALGGITGSGGGGLLET